MIRTLLQFIRWPNSLMAAFAVLVGAFLYTGVFFISFSLFAAMSTAFLLTSFGNVLNDIHDIAIDKIAHPNRPLIKKQIKQDLRKTLFYRSKDQLI